MAWGYSDYKSYYEEQIDNYEDDSDRVEHLIAIICEERVKNSTKIEDYKKLASEKEEMYKQMLELKDQQIKMLMENNNKLMDRICSQPEDNKKDNLILD